MDLEKKLKAEQARCEMELKRLADEKTLNAYQARVDKLKGGGGSFGAILLAAGEAENITLDQHILGRPMTFAFLGKEMKQINSFSLIGSADYVRPGDPQNNARLQGPMAETQSSLAGLGGIGAKLSNRLNLGDDLLKGLKLPF